MAPGSSEAANQGEEGEATVQAAQGSPPKAAGGAPTLRQPTSTSLQHPERSRCSNSLGEVGGCV